MKPDETPTIWKDKEIGLHHEQLPGDRECDVCIVGAGITGLTSAYALVREGRSVIVLDRDQPNEGETGHTSAHLSNAIDNRYYHIESIHGVEVSRLVADSHTSAINCIQRIIAQEHISCEFERLDGYLFAAGEQGEEELERELAAAHRAGLENVHWMRGLPFLGYKHASSLVFPNQARFHPYHYLAGLIDGIRRRGGQIFKENVTAIDEDDPHVVHTASGPTVRCRSVIVAANTPFNNYISVHARQAAYRTYIVGAPLEIGSTIPDALYWDTLDPYHYIRFTNRGGQRWVIVGGEDHKTGQNPATDPFDALKRWVKKHIPEAGPVSYTWSGQINETMDGLALIGRNPGAAPGSYIATGDSGMGLTHGTIAAIILTDLIQGRRNRWAELYDPARVPLKSLGTLTRENMNVAVQYIDYLKSDPAPQDVKLHAGEGRIAQEGNKKVAICRDRDGVMHLRCATCPHMGAIVRWNANEQTWDCPAHGSRFAADGTVIHGPAYSALEEFHSEKEEKELHHAHE